MYCVMRASVPSLYNVYRRYDINTDWPNEVLRYIEEMGGGEDSR